MLFSKQTKCEGVGVRVYGTDIFNWLQIFLHLGFMSPGFQPF